MIFRGCPGTYDRLQLWEPNAILDYKYKENGVGFYIRFVGRNGPNVQMRIIPDEDEPLSAGDDELEYTQNKTVEAGGSLFWEAIPFEMLRTYETDP